jgi:hypothetical protein
MRYDGDLMMSRTQIMFEQEIQRRARRRSGRFRWLRCRREQGRHACGSLHIARTQASTTIRVSLFVDTSIWYAAADKSDASNSRAKAILLGGEPLHQHYENDESQTWRNRRGSK